jgi:hypothetical protein
MRLTVARRRDLLIALVALIGVSIYALAAHAMGGPGFPLDDSWIHQTYARNLAQTGLWAYVPGVPSAGSTSPFYTVLLAIGYALHAPFFAWTYGLGALALAGAGLVGARAAERLFPTVRYVGLITGLTIVAAWHLVWAATSGMETVLFVALTLVVIDLAWGEIGANADWRTRFGRGAAFGLSGAILIATRPEGVLLIGVIGLLMLIARPQPGWRPLAVWCAGALIGGLIGIAPYALLNLSLSGSVLPNTFSAKQAEVAELRDRPFAVNLWAMIQPLTAGGQLLLVPGAIFTLVALARRLRAQRESLLYFAPILWATALILVYAVRLPAPYQHGRYVIPALAPFIVFGVGGTLRLVTQRRLSLVSRALARSLALTTLALFVIFWVYGALIFGRDVQMIQSDMVVASKWLAANVPPDQLLAVHDIGAVGYFAPRPMLDLAGLISPEIIPIIRDPDALMALMQQRGVRYLMVLPAQRPALDNDPRLCERFNAHGQMGGMAIYEMAWDGRCRQYQAGNRNVKNAILMEDTITIPVPIQKARASGVE